MQIKYRLNGKKINLTSDNTTIASTNFNVDKNGNMTCSNANIKGNISAGSKITGSTIEGSSIVAGDNFSVDKNGNMTCSNANITDGEIKIRGGTYLNPKISILDDNNESTSYLAEARLGLQENSNGNFAWMEADERIAMFEIAYQNGANIIGTANETEASLAVGGQGGGTVIKDTGVISPLFTSTGGLITPSIQSMAIYNTNNVTGSANMYITSGGNVRRTTGSSKRWKKDITEEIEERLNPEALYKIPIKQYKYKDEFISKDDVRRGKNILGFIAEDVAEIYEPAVQYDENGQIEMWNKEVMIPAMLKLIQEQHKVQIKQQEEIEELKQEIIKLKGDFYE